MQCAYINKFRERCENASYNDLDVCVLHCAEEEIEESDYKHYRKCFYNFFSKYIFEEVNKKLKEVLTTNHSLTLAEIQSRENELDMFSKLIKDTEEVEVSSSLQGNLRKIDLIVNELKFPKDLVMNSFNSNAKIILKNLGKVLFIDCEFNTTGMLYAEFYYKNCKFNENLRISPFLDLKDGTEYRYEYCNFKASVEVTDSTHSNEINSNLFKECLFNGTVTLKNVDFKKNVFDFPKFDKDFIAGEIRRTYSEYKKYYIIKELKIENCSFSLDLKFNGFDKKNIDVLVEEGYQFEQKDLGVSSIYIIDSKFKSKFEIKNRIIKNLCFSNSNVEGIFDAFESKIEKAYFYKSIFEDFAGFEKVHFGIKNNYSEDYIAKFIYTTFMSFSNFRETVFNSGLDLERVNLKENPNFLKVDVSQKNTNRESFRIIKHSFHSVGNYIEANRFFIYEMKKYRSDLKFFEHPFKKFIICANWLISDFGLSYIRPLIILLLSLWLFIEIQEIQNELYAQTINFLSSNSANLDNSIVKAFDRVSYIANEGSKNIIPFNNLLGHKQGFEFISLLFYIWFSVLIWQIVVSIKRHTQH